MSDAITLGDEPFIHPGCTITASEIGPYTEIGGGSSIVESTIGAYTYTAHDADIIYTDVGRFCSIAAFVRINPGNHPMGRVTQHHCTYRRARFGFGEDEDAFFDWRRAHRCSVGHDVWIGHGAVIMPGVNVGTGAVIGTAAVVTKDVGDYEVAVGVPAKVIKRRFPDRICEALTRIAWWDWDRATLEARFDDLLDIDAFVAKYG